MIDQATQLRRLVLQAANPDPRTGNEPRVLIVSGGKPGVGATTLAVNLAATLSVDALRVVLVDADFSRADVAAQCGLPEAIGIGDVLAGRKSIHEAIQRGPGGLQVVAGTRATATRGSLQERTIQRMLRQLQSLGPHADWVVIDAGHESHELAARLWAAAEQVLLVTSPDAVAVMDTYALVKTLLSRQGLVRPLELVVNQADSSSSAADVHRRIDQSCRRFLGLSPEFAGALPVEPAAPAATRGQTPLALLSPESPWAVAVQRLSQRLVQSPRSLNQRERMAA